ncbi:MAG TPA: translocation/assembly module TamB domain-containing protein [Kofleriaceae bacterium]|nr:translocation/assembly module TamB domain-containing protein [Kofleriaceae bacterium]
MGSAFAILRIKFEGGDLGDNIASILNKRMRGRIEIGSIEWSTASLEKVITGGWVPLTVRDVRVWDDCALSAAVSGDEGDELRSGDPNEDCTPDDRPDPDPRSKRKPRKLLLSTDLVTAEIDIHAVMFGNHDFVFRNLWIHGGEALLEQTREPYPLHAYDRTIVSIVTAFYPRMKASFRAGIYADAPPPIFDLRDIHIAGLNLTLHMSPYQLSKPDQIGYGFTARLEGVDVDSGPDPANNSYLYMDPNDPLVAKFYVRLGVAARRGLVRVLDEGPRSTFRLPSPGQRGTAALAEAYAPASRSALYQLALTDIRLDRLAQLPNEWARHDFVANTLEIDLKARTLPCAADPTRTSPFRPPMPSAGPDPRTDPRDGAQLHLSGELNNYWDRPYDGVWDLRLDGKNMGPTIRSCIKSTVGGDQLDGTISLTGPFVAQPAVGLDLTGVDFDVPLRRGEDPLRLTLAELHGKIDLVNEEGYIEKTKALVRGGKEPGEVELSATFGLKPLYSNAQVEIIKAIDVGRFLPPAVATSVGRFLQGRLRAIGDVEKGFELSDFDLALGATEREKAIRVHHGRLFTNDNFDSIQIEKVFLEAGRSHAMFDGKVDIANNDMNVGITGDFPDLDVWLRRFNLPALFKSASGGGGEIRITGKPTNPRITVTDTTLAGVPCLDKLELRRLTKEGDTITVSEMRSPGLGGELTGNGRITVGAGPPRIEQLELKGARIDASRVCGLQSVARGTIDELSVNLRGEVDPRRSALEWLGLAQIYARADHLTLQGDHYSSVSACVNRKDDRACRPRQAAADAADLKVCDDGKRASAASGSGFCLVAAATRDAGGVLDATIAQLPASRTGPRTTVPARLAGTLSLSDLPLAVIDQLRGQPSAHTVGGVASVKLHLQGSPAAPQAAGAIQILRGWLASGFLGDAQIAVEPAVVRGVPGLALKGSALAGRLAITGSLGTAAPYPVELSIRGRRIEIDPFLDLAGLLKLPDPVQAWASGTITLRTELAPARPDPATAWDAWVELTELTAQLDHRASDGRLTPLVMRVKEQNPKQRAAMSVHVTPTSYALACRDPKASAPAECSTILETPAGDIEIKGHAARSRDARPQAPDKTADRPADKGPDKPLARAGDRGAGKPADKPGDKRPAPGPVAQGAAAPAGLPGKAPEGRAPSRAAEVELTASGDLDLGKLRVLLDQRFDYVAGKVRLLASIGGEFDKPTFEVSLDLDPDQIWQRNEAERTARRAAARARVKRTPVAFQAGESPVMLRPIGSDAVLAAPHGLIKLARGSIGFTDLLLQVRDERHDEDQGDLHVGGNIEIDGLTPVKWSVLFTGKLAGKMLQVLQPNLIAQANGLIEIDGPLVLSGTGARPLLTGTLKFDRFSVFPRGVRRELAFNSGNIEISTQATSDATGPHTTYTFEIADVNGTLDEGQLQNIGGFLQVRDGALSKAGLRLDATSIPFRIAQTLDLTLSASNVSLTLDSPQSNWRVLGTVTVVDGAYLRNFELTDRIQTIGINTAPSKPFWEEYPTLGDAKLDLTLVVQLFAIRDNIATIEFRSDAMPITGSPRDPRLSGQIRVTHGEFRIPGTRAQFIRTSGTVDFAENQPANDPELNITSDADYRDLSGQDHVITVTIGGTLQLPTWDLKTSTGYNKSQTLSLLVLGRNQEQLRRSLGDQTLGGDPTRADPTTNPSQGFADQIVKDLAGDWVSDLLGSSLTKLTGLDVLRIEIGFGSIGFHVEKKMLENARLLGDAEQTIRGTTIKAQAELKTPFVISLQGGYLNQNYYDPAEQDIEDFNVKLVYRVFIP